MESRGFRRDFRSQTAPLAPRIGASTFGYNPCIPCWDRSRALSEIIKNPFGHPFQVETFPMRAAANSSRFVTAMIIPRRNQVAVFPLFFFQRRKTPTNARRLVAEQLHRGLTAIRCLKPVAILVSPRDSFLPVPFHLFLAQGSYLSTSIPRRGIFFPAPRLLLRHRIRA